MGLEKVTKVKEVLDKLREFIVGYDDLITLIGVALLSGGHILIEGPPGTGKTTIARLFAKLTGGVFKRVQMTPDLLPSDIIGTFYYDVKRGEWVLRKGPIFANIVLVDELNRAPPRTQAALLEAMQEGRVTIEGVTLELPKPFLVIASQVPPEVGEGVYPLTSTLIDRFAYSYRVSFLGREFEADIVKKAELIEEVEDSLKPVTDAEAVLEARNEVKNVYVSDKVLEYIVSIVDAVRKRREVLLGPSPRASIWMYRGAKALAALQGMDYVIPDHVKWVARFVLPHRIKLRPAFEADSVNREKLVEDVLNAVEVPKFS